jgi:hypothetical protein
MFLVAVWECLFLTFWLGGSAQRQRRWIDFEQFAVFDEAFQIVSIKPCGCASHCLVNRCLHGYDAESRKRLLRGLS